MLRHRNATIGGVGITLRENALPLLYFRMCLNVLYDDRQKKVGSFGISTASEFWGQQTKGKREKLMRFYREWTPSGKRNSEKFYLVLPCRHRLGTMSEHSESPRFLRRLLVSAADHDNKPRHLCDKEFVSAALLCASVGKHAHL